MIVWSIANQKGGVGKTTTTITLAGLLSKQGKRVLLVDTDPHGSLTTYLGYDSDSVPSSLFDLFQLKDFTEQSVMPLVMRSDIEGIDLIPAHMSLATLDRVMGNRSGMGLILKRALLAIKEHYDYVLIDCPPILGVMMVNALAASDRILIPVQTEFLAMKGLERMVRTLAIMQKSRNKSLMSPLFRPCTISALEHRFKHCSSLSKTIRRKFGLLRFQSIRNSGMQV